MNTLEADLHEFVVATFWIERQDGLVLLEDTSFIKIGILDSFGMLDLVSHLEEKYGLRIEDDELALHNLDSISQLAKFIRRKQAEFDAHEETP